MPVQSRQPDPPEELPQRVLRNDISRVLREVEAGKRFHVTVNGRVVAELGQPRGLRKRATMREAAAMIERARRRPDPTFWDDTASARKPYEPRLPL